MRIHILNGATLIRPLVLIAVVLAACGGQNSSELASDSVVSQPEQTSESIVSSEQSFNSGTTHFQQREYELAINDLDQAIRLDPTYALAYSTKGTALIYLGQFQVAIDELDHAIQLEPQFAVAYRSRGLAYVGLGREERGIEDYDIAIRLDPEFGLAYADRSIAYVRMEDDTAAQRDLELAVGFGVSRSVLEFALEQIRNGR